MNVPRVKSVAAYIVLLSCIHERRNVLLSVTCYQRKRKKNTFPKANLRGEVNSEINTFILWETAWADMCCMITILLLNSFRVKITFTPI